jgi:hypothetical protein
MKNYMKRLIIAVLVLLASCAHSSQPRSVDPSMQARLDDAKSLIGKQIWIRGFTRWVLDPFFVCDTPTPEGHCDLKAIGPVYVKDVIPSINAIYLVATDTQGKTTYLRSYSSTPLEDVRFEDPTVVAARAKQICAKKGGVHIGMTEKAVLASCWGKPEKRNVTITAHGEHDQWVYGNGSYVYLEDGIVTAIQN